MLVNGYAYLSKLPCFLLGHLHVGGQETEGFQQPGLIRGQGLRCLAALSTLLPQLPVHGAVRGDPSLQLVGCKDMEVKKLLHYWKQELLGIQ
jgi:hypothetical protein